ncbi:PREDICTED: uncharacterized protein LOC105129384 [Populus euphratica]|uniref:Uncharacterized protein LOC105129384 n=1 Tax=Populus euphratica TaxID=75702 RepID=A0AAJ6UIB3_POPEU|nr:PREDICTED: uncharacterized protein LOC105129384 [Populus euphratica]
MEFAPPRVLVKRVMLIIRRQTSEKVAVQQEKENDNERPPFDINLAVVLAGFAFEAYTSPPKNVGKWEADAAGCKIVHLSEEEAILMWLWNWMDRLSKARSNGGKRSQLGTRTSLLTLSCLWPKIFRLQLGMQTL